ncbi:hypothetical protein [Methylobacterium planeticum]|uniref:Uncharacterized protein n=1 Tax=Methylobacterium planeticum TaxID=2615211 RepID=A0A6N6MPG7_9HYPH|nr:hypothetical protein [Methylobacterium planeticum]KAB1072143.1 hypothetical protein F6X51_17090 [Methylobacterium planeticum]
MTTHALPRLAILLALVSAALAASAGAARAQAAVRLEGSCSRLVIAGQDLSGACAGTLMNTVARTRTSFDFAARDGQTLSFSGTGSQQERTEETDPLQPINLVIPGRKTPEGVVQNPVLAVGACRFTNPEPGKTEIACEANSAEKGAFAATFLTETRPAPGAPKP